MIKNKYKHYVIPATLAVVISGVAVIFGGRGNGRLTLYPFLPSSVLHASAVDANTTVILRIPQEPAAPLRRVAARLQARIRRNNGQTLSLDSLATAIEERRDILRRSIAVRYAVDDGRDFGTWDASLAALAHWIHADIRDGALQFAVDEEQVRRHLEQFLPEGLVSPVDTVLQGSEVRNGVRYAITGRPAEPGYAFDAAANARLLSVALSSGEASVSLPVSFIPGVVVNESGEDFGPLELLATGRSDFRGSGDGRIANVRLGLQAYLNNVLIAPGETFSFNASVNNMNGGGWRDALVIMNGTELVPFPGGGICQVATTVYRAALLAGFPISERANHSLYVTYYEKFGVGIDATIFPKKQDLTFVNDTDRYLLLQAYTHGFEAYVHLYGVRDGRKVTMSGPYFQTNETDEIRSLMGRTLRANEIAWIRKVSSPVGSESAETILSRYQSVPKRLKLEYAQKTDDGYLSMQ